MLPSAKPGSNANLFRSLVVMPIAIAPAPPAVVIAISASPIMVSISVYEPADASAVVIPASPVLNILCNAWCFDTSHGICADRCGVCSTNKCECDAETTALRKCLDHEASLSSRRRILGVVERNDLSAAWFLLRSLDDHFMRTVSCWWSRFLWFGSRALIRLAHVAHHVRYDRASVRHACRHPVGATGRQIIALTLAHPSPYHSARSGE